MTTPARAAEADRATVAFQIALTQLGVASIEEALALWSNVPPTNAGATSAAWLRRAIFLISTRRRRSRDLALAYYRLVRALRTGRTIADPRKPEPRFVSMETLRREFSELAGPQRPDERTGELPPSQDTPALEIAPEEPTSEPLEGDEDSDADRILVEEIEALDAAMRENERAAEEEARLVLEQLGPNRLEKDEQERSDAAPARDVDASREDSHRTAGSRVAMATQRLTVNGARSTIWSAAQRDSRVIGYIRLSRTGTPCGWCAMLISRGPVYRSEQSATYAEGDLYHDNCNCYAEPVYSREQYASSPLYELNRRYQEEWPRVTAGLSGKDALRAWRKHIRQEQKAAQEAASTQPNVQEA